MKKVWSKWMVMVMASVMLSVFSINTSKAQGSVSLQVFYDELQPYGTWMDHGSYGYVWMPRVDRGFSPYATNGYWINTEYGNTWVSDYSWGWAPFHYGRWFYDDFYGWMWVPDTVWGPAWVTWRSGGGYYGWAPLMPGFGIHMGFNYYSRIPHSYWSFVPYRYITYRHVYRHCVPRPQVVNIINNTTIVTNNYTDNRRRTYFTGPSRSEIERTNRERVPVYKVNDRNQPGRTDIERGTVSFYKPEIDNSKNSRTRAMPSRYVRDDGRGKLEQVESRRDRTSEIQGGRNTDDLRKRSEQLNLERSDVNRDDRQRDLDRMERSQQLEMEKQNDAFQRFERERENPKREEQQKFNQRRDLSQPQRSQQLERDREIQRQNDVFQRFERDENSNREEQQKFNQRREQLERQNAPIRTVPPEQNNQRQREQFNRPEQEMRRAPAKQPQRLQQIERQNTNRFPNGSGQVSQPSERQRSTVTPNNNRSSSVQREQQFRSGSSDLRSKQPSQGGGVERTPRRRN